MRSIVLCTGFLAAQIWFTKGGVAEYAQLVPDAKREYTELCIGWLLVRGRDRLTVWTMRYY